MILFTGQWTEAPEKVWDDAGTLYAKPKSRSDFWRDPRDGSISDNGHLMGSWFRSDMSCEVEVSGTFAAEYDQCGLMLRIDAERWMKVVLDVVGQRLKIATVVTNGVSDSALQNFSGTPSSCWFRISWIAGVIIAETRLNRDVPYEVIRLARLGANGPFLLGPVCCAPTGGDFTAGFRNLSFGPSPVGTVA